MFEQRTTGQPEIEYALDAFIAWWNEQRMKNGTAVAPETGLNYARDLRHLVASGYPLPPDLDMPSARRYVAERLIDRQGDPRNGEPIGVERQKTLMRAIKAFSRHRFEDYAEPDKFTAWRFPASPDPVGGKIAAKDEVSKLLKCVTTDRTFNGHRDAAMIAVLWSAGLRRSDLARLTIEDIDLTARVAWVRRSKGGKSRTVPLTRESVVLLTRYLAARARHPYAADRALWLSTRTHAIAGGRQSAALRPDAISGMLDKRCRTAGVKLAAHTFRRGFAADAKSLGMSDSDVMQIAGWTSITTFQRYVKQSASKLAIDSAHRLRG